MTLDPVDEGIVAGLLAGEGSFGGDGRKPQVTLRVHVRREAVVRWLAERVPGSRVYGPYHHGNRHYVQWMVRGAALIEGLLPVLERHLTPELDAHAHGRMVGMVERYADAIERVRRRADAVR